MMKDYNYNSGSKEKDLIRNELVFPLFEHYAKIKKQPNVLELMDKELKCVSYYLKLSPSCKITGITLGDQMTKNSKFNIFKGNMKHIVTKDIFFRYNKSGFDFINLDFYGPGRYFDYSKITNYDFVIKNLFKLQKDNNYFGVVITLDYFDYLIPRKDQRIKLGDKIINIKKELKNRFVSKIAKFCIAKNFVERYEKYITIAGIIKTITIIATTNNYSTKIFKCPMSYIGVSNNHITPMITIAFKFDKSKNTLSDSKMIDIIKKTKYLY